MVERKEKRISATRVLAEAGPKNARPGRRERNKQDKLKRIVAAAQELFGSKGFANTTTQEIADKADIGTGTLFLYVRSKEDLLIMVFKDEMIARSQNAFSKAPAGASLLDQLLHIFSTLIAYHSRDIALARVLIKEITILANPDRRADIAELMLAIHSGFAEIIAARQATGELRANVSPLLAAQNIFAVYYISLISWLGGQTTKQQFVSQLRPRLSLAIEGLANPETAPRSKPTRKA